MAYGTLSYGQISCAPDPNYPDSFVKENLSHVDSFGLI